MALELLSIAGSIRIYNMKRRFLQYVCLALFITMVPGWLDAFELEITAGVNGMSFHPDKTRSHTEAGDEFGPYPYGIANFTFSHEFNGSLSFILNIERDNILQNSLNFRLASRSDRFRFEFGPFLGMTDSVETPNAGIIGELELTFPGIFYVSISGSSALGTQIDFLSANHRETAGVKAGFWLGNLILSFNANYKNLTRQKDEYLVVSDTLTRFGGCLDFYAKNSKVNGNIIAGYQIYSRDYRRGKSLETSDELSMWFAGGQLNWQVSNPLKLILGLEVPVYITPVKPMKVTENFLLMTKLYTGFAYTFR